MIMNDEDNIDLKTQKSLKCCYLGKDNNNLDKAKLCNKIKNGQMKELYHILT